MVPDKTWEQCSWKWRLEPYGIIDRDRSVDFALVLGQQVHGFLVVDLTFWVRGAFRRVFLNLMVSH
jgi:hypothetical protein